jgi:hypothetical protein
MSLLKRRVSSGKGFTPQGDKDEYVWIADIRADDIQKSFSLYRDKRDALEIDGDTIKEAILFGRKRIKQLIVMQQEKEQALLALLTDEERKQI